MVKKSELLWGMTYLLAGLACLLGALLTKGPMDSLLFGLAGAGTLPGIMMIFKYFYWNAEKNRDRYQERLENESIERHDELKEKLRDKSGRCAYVLGLLLVCVSMLVFSVLDALGIVEGRLIIFYLFGYLVVQIAAGVIIFNRLLKKY